MRRFVSLAVLLFFTVPFGASMVGCGSKTVTVFCNGGDSGPVVGQVKSITLSPAFATFGESIDFGQIGSALSATAVDCKGSQVSVNRYVFATTDMSFADINPSTGSVCGGTWNRNTGGGIPDYTLCTTPVNPPANTVAYVTATADGAVSNAIPVYVHPVVTSIVLGSPSPTASSFGVTGYSIGSASTTFTASSAPFIGSAVTLSGFPTSTFLNGQQVTVTSSATNSFTVATTFGKAVSTAPVTEAGTATSSSAVCLATSDPATNCCPVSTTAVLTAPAYTGTSCLSQRTSAQLTARAYQNGTVNPSDNLTCRIGHLQYSAQNSSVLTIDQNGVATAAQPGSTIITASIATSGSGGAAGFFSTCPPASIALAIPGTTATSQNVNVNTSQPLTATVVDTNNVVLTGINLTYVSTTPTTIPAGSGTVTPAFPGSATITAECLPPACNSAPISQAGVFGNGKTVTSNGIQITSPGTNATVLYIASTQSQYLLPVDFSTNQQGTLVKLPYVPNSMVLANDGGTLFLGSTTAMMSVSATNFQVTNTSLGAAGTVLSISPNSQTLVVTDPVRKTVSLVTATGSTETTTGGVGTSAQWSPDSSTVYITAQNNQLLVHSDYNGWYTIPTSVQYVDVATTIPSVGAFFATNTNITEARSYCPVTTVTPGTPPVATNIYDPVANDTAVQNDHLAATNDGNHILGATVSGGATLNDIAVTIPSSALRCSTAPTPVTFGTTFTQHPLVGAAATAITGVVPASNSALAFVTYTGTGGILPEYIPGTGAVVPVVLSGGATAPVAGVFSTDNTTFFTGTSGDNQVHLISVTGTTAADQPTKVIAPKLPDGNGNTVVPNLIAQRPKKSTT